MDVSTETGPKDHSTASPPDKKRNLLIVRAGDQSLHGSWIGGPGERSFDLMISYFGNVPGRYVNDCQYYRQEKGLKWPPISEIVEQQWELLCSYDCVVFPDDDLMASPEIWREALNIFHEEKLDLAQPSITGYVNWPILAQKRGLKLRLVNFVEVMTPMLSRRTLEHIRHTFGLSKSGWGLDWIWSNLLPYPEYRLAVIDRVTVRHTRKVGGGDLYKLTKALGVDPHKEADIAKHYGGARECREYACVPDSNAGKG